MVKAAVSPALIVPLSAVFRTVTSGHRTVIVAVDELLPCRPGPSFVEATVAVFTRSPQALALGVPVTWMVRVADGPRSPKSQVRTLLAIEQSALSSLHTTPAGSGSFRVTCV